MNSWRQKITIFKRRKQLSVFQEKDNSGSDVEDRREVRETKTGF